MALLSWFTCECKRTSQCGPCSQSTHDNNLITAFQSNGHDSDEEDLIALSSRWKLQNKNRRWSSRKDNSTLIKQNGTSGISSSHIGINTASSIQQRSLRKMDRLGHDQLSTFTHLDLCLSQGRASVYDNLCPNLSVSTPSISNVGKDVNKNDSLSGTIRSQKRNLANSDLGLESCSASSNDDLSEQDDEVDDLPGDLSMLRTIRNSERQCRDLEKGLSSPKVERPKLRWHSFQKSSRPDICVL